MEQVTTVPLTQQNTDPNESLTLEQARERMRTLMSHGESNAWDIGDLLNTVERRGLARTAGYGKTRSWLEAEVPEVGGKTSTLYRYADVASHYTRSTLNCGEWPSWLVSPSTTDRCWDMRFQETRVNAKSSYFKRTARQ